MHERDEIHLWLDQTNFGFVSFQFIFLFIYNITIILGNSYEDVETKTQNVGNYSREFYYYENTYIGNIS